MQRVKTLTATLPLALALALAAAAPAGANPMPEGMIFTHVQEHVPDFCATTTITECEMIEQSTAATGLLDFALFHQPFGFPELIESMTVTMTWPQGWSYVGADLCTGTAISFLPSSNGAVLEIEYGGSAAMDEFFPIVAMTLDATGPGAFAIPSVLYTLAGGFQLELYGIPARAGLVCGNCAQSCSFLDDCFVGTSVSELELTVASGGTTQGQFRGWAAGLNPLCDVGFAEELDFLDLLVETSPLGGYDVTVLVDATGLAVGLHEGWVIGTSPLCHECVRILVTVTEPAPVDARSWGAIKESFRR